MICATADGCGDLIGLRVRISQTDLAVDTASEADAARSKRRQHIAGLGTASSAFQHDDRPLDDAGLPGELLLGSIQKHARGAIVACPQKIEIVAYVGTNVHYDLQDCEARYDPSEPNQACTGSMAMGARRPAVARPAPRRPRTCGRERRMKEACPPRRSPDPMGRPAASKPMRAYGGPADPGRADGRGAVRAVRPAGEPPQARTPPRFIWRGPGRYRPAPAGARRAAPPAGGRRRSGPRGRTKSRAPRGNARRWPAR